MASYYISPEGSDTLGAGTALDPWRTIAKLNSTLAAGDTGYLYTGNYDGQTISPINNGIAGNPITYTAVSGNTPVIRRVSTGINLVNKSYINVSNISINGERWIGFITVANTPFSTSSTTSSTVKTWATIDGCTRCEFDNLTCDYAYGSTNTFEIKNSTYIKVLNSALRTAGTPFEPNESGYANVIRIWTTSYYCLIDNCTLKYGGHDVLDVAKSSRYNIVRNCSLYNDWTNAPTTAVVGAPTVGSYFPKAGLNGVSITRPGARCAELRGNQNITPLSGNNLINCGYNLFERNYLDGTGENYRALKAAMTKISGDGWIVRNNVYTNAMGDAIATTDFDGGGYCRNNQIYSNTFYKINAGIWNVEKDLDTALGMSGNIFQQNLANKTRLNATYTGAPIADITWRKYAASNIDTPLTAASVFNNILIRSPGVPCTMGYLGVVQTITDMEANHAAYVANNIQSGTVAFVNGSGAFSAYTDFKPTTGDAAINAGGALATTTNSGTSATVPVSNPYLFAHWRYQVDGVGDDWIIGSTAVTVIGADLTNSTITLSSAITFANGASIYRPYTNSAPDIGAIETSAIAVVDCFDDSTTTAHNTTVTDYAVLTNNDVNAAAITAISNQVGGTFTATTSDTKITFVPTTGFSGVASCTYTARNTDSTSTDTATFSVTVAAAATSDGIIFQDTFADGTPEGGEVADWEASPGGTVSGGVCTFNTLVGRYVDAGVTVKECTAYAVNTTPVSGQIARLVIWGLRDASGYGYYLRIVSSRYLSIHKTTASGAEVIVYSPGVAVLPSFPCDVSFKVIPNGSTDVSFEVKVNGVVDTRYSTPYSTAPLIETGTFCGLEMTKFDSGAGAVSVSEFTVVGEVVTPPSGPTAYDYTTGYFAAVAKKTAAVEHDVLSLCSASTSLVSAYVTGATTSTVSIVDQKIQFTPGTAAETATYTYVISDGVNTDVGTVETVVTNTVPTGAALTLTVPHNKGTLQYYSATFAVTDDDSDPMTIAKAANPSSPGALSVTILDSGAGTGSTLIGIASTPDISGDAPGAYLRNYTGGTYTVSDDDGGTSSPIAYTIQVRAASISDQTSGTEMNAAVSWDIEADWQSGATNLAIVSVTSQTPTANVSDEGGTLSVNGLVITYTPPTDFTGTDYFIVNIHDSVVTAATDSALITVVVTDSVEYDNVSYSSATFADILRLSYPDVERTGNVAVDCGVSSTLGNDLAYSITTAPNVGTLSVDEATGDYSIIVSYGTTAAITFGITATSADDLQEFTYTLTPIAASTLSSRVMSYDVANYGTGGLIGFDNQALANVIGQDTPTIACLQGFPTEFGDSGYTQATLAAELVEMIGFDGYTLSGTNAVLYKGSLGNTQSGDFYHIATVTNPSGKSATFASVELSTNATTRLAQISELYAVTSAISWPVVIAGNFNHVSGDASFTEAESLWDSCYGIESPTGGTYTTGTVINDYIYLQTATGWASLCTASHIVDDGFTHSDHNPVYADLTFIQESAQMRASGGELGRILGKSIF